VERPSHYDLPALGRANRRCPQLLTDIPQMNPWNGANASILPGAGEAMGGRQSFRCRLRRARRAATGFGFRLVWSQALRGRAASPIIHHEKSSAGDLMRLLVQVCLAAVGLFASASKNVAAEIIVHSCRLPGFDTPLVVTIYDDGTPSRVGVEVGVGSRASTYFDPPTGATMVVEFNGGNVPITLTTINRDGQAVHSRHLVIIPKGWFSPTQTIGQCERRTIR